LINKNWSTFINLVIN